MDDPAPNLVRTTAREARESGSLTSGESRAQALTAALWVYSQLSEEERLLVVSQWLLSQENEVDP